ncbi:ribonuclease [Streptococcus chenjunshii]|uniref:Ribonuclease n=1 Tax=Streptococcus chenjunshii TaxID=2173853 RepID=A0A372KMR5_9STRE|nr:ribonuclease [Streptococcus chenjunshii]AXQ78284.1 ribonuclease [Streptococcus chenjunshii]RFU50731.1 ribonuclease [Streptococcus chenjunshii]RFU52868.1 ribonuclease [Streptococcus chenjunshii]
MSWEFILMMFFFIFIIGLVTVASVFSNIANIAKWLGLGAIAGNVLNNKINANAAVKSGRQFRKRKMKIKNPIAEKVADFISPPTGEEAEPLVQKDYQEFQEFIEWKKSKNKQE